MNAAPIASPPPATVEAIADSPAPPIGAGFVDARPDDYRVGTLSYTRRGLANVFTWMLWGDLCLNVMESIIPRLVPMQLRALGGSNALIGVLTVTVFSVMNWVMNPILSTWSDRARTRLGRRIPFMLFASPFLAVALTLVGCSADIARMLDAHAPRVAAALAWASGHLLPEVGVLPRGAQLSIGVLAVALIAYKFFDLFPQCVYYYLFTDVIPQRVIGRFICSFRIVAALGAILFHYFLLGHADTHPRAIYVGCALLYLVAFVLIGLFVREGRYPPPPTSSGASVATVTAWFCESFSNAFYWKVFVVSALTRWTFTIFNAFLIVYAQKRLGLDAGAFGHSVALMMLMQLPTLLLLGPVLDRFHPTRVAIGGYAMMAFTGGLAFAFVRDRATFTVATCCVFVAAAVLQGMMSTLLPRVMPRERYGQFSAATSMVIESGMIVLAFACGAMLDRFGEHYLYLWLCALSCVGVAASVVLYRAWLALGGDAGYAPPAVAS